MKKLLLFILLIMPAFSQTGLKLVDGTGTEKGTTANPLTVANGSAGAGAQQVQGTTASGGTLAGNPIVIAGQGVSGGPVKIPSVDNYGNQDVNNATQLGLLVLNYPFTFNGTTWDRQRGNFNTTTGDSGVQTASFNGAAQINYNARGATITIILGAVSGTTPTLAVQPQWSPDGGTTWLAWGPVLPNLTATSQTGAIVIYPTNLSTAGATPAAFTVGSTVSVASNAPLPRTWRLAYTIGGTTPSFAISSVQVNYLN